MLVTSLPPPKQRFECVYCDGTDAGTTGRTSGAGPIVGVRGGVVEVLLGRTFLGLFPFLKKKREKGNLVNRMFAMPKEPTKAHLRDHGKQPNH